MAAKENKVSYNSGGTCSARTHGLETTRYPSPATGRDRFSLQQRRYTSPGGRRASENDLVTQDGTTSVDIHLESHPGGAASGAHCINNSGTQAINTNTATRAIGVDQTGGKSYLSPDSGTGLIKSPSLQRIHQQSSTETSGLGESIILGFSSQESVRSTHSNVLYNDRVVRPETTRTTHNNPRRCSTTGLGDDEQHVSHGSNPTTKSRPMREDWTDTKPLILTTADKGSKRKKSESSTGTVVVRKYDSDFSSMYPDGTDFDSLFTNSGKPHSNSFSAVQYESNDGTVVKLDRRGPNRGSTKSQLSINDSIRSRSGSFKSATGSIRRFLGSKTESAWAKWSKARRESYKKRLELPELKNDQPPERASTPIKKAREEGLMFVHEDLKGNYISEEDINYIRRHRIERYKTFHVIEKSNKKKSKLRNFNTHNELQVSIRDWRILSNFWQHNVFSRARYAAFFFALISIVFIIISVTSPQWLVYVFITEGKCVVIFVLRHFFAYVVVLLCMYDF